jgi:hypothetical protein
MSEHLPLFMHRLTGTAMSPPFGSMQQRWEGVQTKMPGGMDHA